MKKACGRPGHSGGRCLQKSLTPAQPIADAHQMTIVLDPELRERCYGAFEGLMYEEITQRYPKEFAAWHARDLHLRFPAGERDAETLQEFHQRSVSALERIARRHAQGRIVVITHGGVLDCVYREATGMSVEAKRDFETINAAINRLRWDGKRFVLLQWADISHLESAGLDEIDRTHPAA
jgi:probable phosphoglycerate mutase